MAPWSVAAGSLFVVPLATLCWAPNRVAWSIPTLCRRSLLESLLRPPLALLLESVDLSLPEPDSDEDADVGIGVGPRPLPSRRPFWNDPSALPLLKSWITAVMKM